VGHGFEIISTANSEIRRGGIECHPSLISKVGLHPTVGVAVADEIVFPIGVPVPAEVPVNHSSRNAYTAKHHRQRRRIIFAIPLADLEEKTCQRVSPAGWKALQGVTIVLF
jgi:hypothetical protein